MVEQKRGGGLVFSPPFSLQFLYILHRIFSFYWDNEVWKLVNEVTKPKEDKTWTLKEGEEIITYETEIANIFNTFFKETIFSGLINCDILVGYYIN